MNGRRNHFIYANPCQALSAAAVSGELCPSGLTWKVLLSAEMLSLPDQQHCLCRDCSLGHSQASRVSPPQQKQSPVQVLGNVPLL